MRKAFMVLLIVPLTCTAQIKPDELHFNHLSINNGLAEDFITAMLQDTRGCMWIGTQAGLVPFFTTKPTGQGIGLGLSLVYDIIKAHGGELKVETKEGGRSEFIIQLPGM
jgi:nitrogen fixation/metabolism regulation signal transduction histidine kinase